MRKILLPWTAGIAAVISLVSSSCTYDPYYSSSGSYYGGGYGYGGGSVSTSLFVSTGDPHWGYDPHSYCYYDYRSRRYYDPYLYGYYPVGYRPYAVYGVPHPYGWRQGHGHCPPPRTVRNVTVVNYRDRESAYRNSNYSWARNVRHRESENSYRHHDSRKPEYRRDYRTDYRTRDNDRDSYKSRSSPTRETIRTREYTPDPRENRDRHQRDDYRSTERSSPREFRPESTRHQSMPRPQSSHQFDRRQFEHPKENRSRDNNDSRGKSSDSHEKKSERKSLRSLGDG